jgi:hypothetical protein
VSILTTPTQSAPTIRPSSGALPYLAFLVWPFFSFVYALINIQSRYAKNIIWLFCAFYGSTFVISTEEMDASRYRRLLDEMYAARNQPFLDLLIEPFQQGIYSATDVYAHLLTISVSRFTNSFELLFFLVGGVFGYFYSRNAAYILPYLHKRRLGLFGGLMIAILLTIIPFWNINGYRFYTATHMLLFAMLRVVIEKKYRYFWVVLLTPLVHGSFLGIVGACGLYLIIGNRYQWYLAALIVALFSSGINPAAINKNTKEAPIYMQNKVSGYTSKDYIKFVQKNTVGQVWYVEGHIQALKFIVYSFVAFVWFKRKKILTNRVAVSLYSMSLYMLTLAALVAGIPSGGRFFSVAVLFLGVLMVYVAQHRAIEAWWARWLGYIYLLPVLCYVIVEIRIGFDSMGINTLLANPILAFVLPNEVPLIDFFK